MKTKELTEDQVNLICATFEGKDFFKDAQDSSYSYIEDENCIIQHLYTESLDNLLTVWEKLSDRVSISVISDSRVTCDAHGIMHSFRLCDDLLSNHFLDYQSYEYVRSYAYCTALAILEIKPELKELL